VIALISATEIWRDNGSTLTVTSATDGTHTRASKHYTGCAVDLRTRGLADPEKAVRELQDALRDDYDVILEGRGTANEHCHVEFDPKAPY
jgi:hypothetical protein